MVSGAANGVLSIAAGAKQQDDVAADGRFLIIVPVAESAVQAPISVILNWPATLSR